MKRSLNQLTSVGRLGIGISSNVEQEKAIFQVGHLQLDGTYLPRFDGKMSLSPIHCIPLQYHITGTSRISVEGQRVSDKNCLNSCKTPHGLTLLTEGQGLRVLGSRY
jgi:hypothetical protein